MDCLLDHSDAFWAWARDHFCPCYSGPEDQALLFELAGRIGRMGVFGFEIGPTPEGLYLAISPKGRPDRYVQTKAVVARAPVMEGWTFLPAKPEKEWELARFGVVRGASLVELDLSRWELVVLRFHDGMRDVYFRPTTETGLSRDELLAVAITVVDGAVGEGRRIDCVNFIDVKDEWNDLEGPTARPLTAEGLRRALARDLDRHHPRA